MGEFFRNLLKLIRSYLEQVRDGELRLVAASLAFASILGLVPFVAVTLVTLHTFGGSPKLMLKIENLLLSHFKVAAGGETVNLIKMFIRNIQMSNLGVGGAVFMFITAIGLLKFMEDGVHRIWINYQKRSVLLRLVTYALLIVLWPMVLATYVAFISLEELALVRRLIPAMLMDPLILIMALFTVYKIVPTGKIRTLYALISASIASISLILLQNTFSFAAKKVFQYNQIYGAFAAIPLFLIWLLIVWYIIMGGVAICAALHRHRDNKIKNWIEENNPG